MCHQHSKCTYDYVFNSDYVIGENWGENLSSEGFQHTDPMPIVEEQQLSLSSQIDYRVDNHTFDFALRGDTRLVETNVYITRQDSAFSLLSGYCYEKDSSVLDSELGLIQRLPSTQELYWNGFHHATDTYILGDSDATNETSLNFDISYALKSTLFELKMSGFYYYFFNYLYQSRMVDENGDVVSDPYHAADVWEIVSNEAMIYGGAFDTKFKFSIDSSKFELYSKLEALQGRLISGGYIPRMSPISLTSGVNYKLGDFSSQLSYKIVDRARFLGENESETDGYDWLSFSLLYDFMIGGVKNSFWIKGENLTDSIAYNHLSFLRSSAPLMGRSIRTGCSLTF